MDILIVGHDVISSEYRRRISEKLGHRLEKADTGKDALEIAVSRNFDLVLLDIFLPDIKGYELIPELKKIWLEPKIIAVTGSNSRELELKVRNQGVIYYMIKPVDIKYLETIINYISDKQPASANCKP
ncbi:MAG: response regulator [Desulfobacterales bacterium]|nr:response regulator [Desulfobacterales bacterium]